MSEQVSAVSSIADACEFRFARFYIVWWLDDMRDTRKSAHCLHLSDTSCGLSKRGKTQNKMSNTTWKKCSYFASRMLHTQAASEHILPCIYSAVILLPHKDCFPPSGAPGAGTVVTLLKHPVKKLLIKEAMPLHDLLPDRPCAADPDRYN